MDLLATKAANLFPEMEKTNSYAKRRASVIQQRQQQQQQQEQQKDDNSHPDEDGIGETETNYDNDSSLRFSNNNLDGYVKEQEHYYLYIYDRVSGNSYVPKMYRNLDNCGSEHYHCSQENPTDRWNRPPHYFCYIPPFVRRFPGLLEQNAFCNFFGRCGFHQYFKNRHEARRRVFFIGFTFNLAALCLSVVSAMAFTRNYNLLTHTSFSRGEAYIPALSNSTKFTIDIGFRALAWTDPFGFTGHVGDGQVVTFSDYCQSTDELSDLLFEQLCGSCKSSSQTFVVSTVANIFIILRNMFSDVTRMYPKYDLNCPNFYGSMMATVSSLLAIFTVFKYASTCAGNNHSGEITTGFVLDSNVLQEYKDLLGDNATGETLVVNFEWSNGPGLTCLIVATFLKIIDAICNYIVPTPAITRDIDEQRDYELKFGDYAERTFLDNEADKAYDSHFLEQEKQELGPSHLVLERLKSNGSEEKKVEDERTAPLSQLSMVRETTFGEAGDEEDPLNNGMNGLELADDGGGQNSNNGDGDVSLGEDSDLHNEFPELANTKKK